MSSQPVQGGSQGFFVRYIRHQVETWVTSTKYKGRGREKQFQKPVLKQHDGISVLCCIAWDSVGLESTVSSRSSGDVEEMRQKGKHQNNHIALYVWPGSCFPVARSCPILCDPMNCNTPGLPVLTVSQSSLKPMSTESVMPSNHLILCHPLLLPSVFPSIRVFSSESSPQYEGAWFWTLFNSVMYCF